MEQKIIDILQRVFQTDSITETSSQNNCEQWDSLHHLNLIIELESEFNITFEPEEIAQMTSVSEIKCIISKKTAH